MKKVDERTTVLCRRCDKRMKKTAYWGTDIIFNCECGAEVDVMVD